MTKEKLIRYGKDYLHDLETACCSISDIHKEFVREAIKSLEIVEEFEKAQIITGGRLNGRTYAYKCGLEDGKRKSLEQQPSEDCVDRANLLKKFEDRFIELQKAHQTDKQLGVNWCINTLKDAPPVTPTHGTCKNCNHRDPENKLCDCGHSIEWQTPRPDDWYCKDYEK